MKKILGLGAFALCGLALAATPLKEGQLHFTYQQNNDPWTNGECQHELSADSPYDWQVSCTINGQPRAYLVHLAFSVYPRSIHGGSAYELLYWVTDTTDPRHPESHSSTIWVHNTSKDARPKVVEAAQGIENDAASLRLEIDL